MNTCVSRRLFTAIVAAVALLGVGRPVSAQITSARVSGTVRDTSGGVVPGAMVILISDARKTQLEATCGGGGDFVFPTVQADTYTVRVTMDGFKTLERGNVVVHAGETVAVGNLTIEVGALQEVVTVTGEAPVIQAQSGERSFAVTQEVLKNIAVEGRSINNLALLSPGVIAGSTSNGTFSVNGLRVNQNNYQVDGVGATDTGNNVSMIAVNTEAVAEVNVLTSNYQAEYGRSAGAQISAVTKSGTAQFRGSAYWDRRNDDMNANSWYNNREGVAKPKLDQKDYGFTLGGPIGKQGAGNKLFFFTNLEYQHVITAGALNRMRLPTALERLGDFSQTRDNNGNLFPYVRDYTTGLPCSASDTRGCFQDGGVLGRIPQNRLTYDVGLALVKMYPLPNATQGESGAPAYNYQSLAPNGQNPRDQELIRLDYQPRPSMRIYGKVLQTGGYQFTPGSIPGLNDRKNEMPGNRSISAAMDKTISSSMVMEVTYGQSRNQLGNVAVKGRTNLTRAALGLQNFPFIYPDALNVSKDIASFFRFSGNQGWINDGHLEIAPMTSWGGRVAGSITNAYNPPQLCVGSITNDPTAVQYGCNAPFENVNRTQDWVASVTKLFGQHTVKTGFYLTHSFKPQVAFGSPSGAVNFANDTNNPYDTGHPFANAILGIYNTYEQSSAFLQPEWVYNNIEWYAQDNWRVTNKLTIDYGVRFYWIQPQHDATGKASNFLPDRYDPAKAPRLYYPAIVNGVKVGQDTVTGQTVQAAYIGRRVPGSGDMLNGVFQEGGGQITSGGYLGRGIMAAPRFGFAWDVRGDQKLVVRGGSGVFYNRERGDTVFNMIQNVPATTKAQLQYGLLQDITPGAANTPSAVPQLFVFDYDAKVPTNIPYNVGVQMPLGWSSALDISLVGSIGINQITQRQINAPNYGAAYLPQNQDPTLAASTIPGATALLVDFLRPYRGYSDIMMMEATAKTRYKSLQTSFRRNYKNNVSFGVNYTLGKAMGTSPNDIPGKASLGAPRSDSNQEKANYMPLDIDRRHTMTANFVYGLPKTGSRAIGYVVNGWQLSGVIRVSSGAHYTPTYSFQQGLTAKNLTGAEGLESARIVLAGDPGSGHTSDPYRMLNAAAFTTPVPGSIGLESGLNYMTYTPDHTVDLSLSRVVRFAGNRVFEIRADAFNVFNTVIYTGINTTLQVKSYTDPTPVNLPYNSSGQLVWANRAGFGAVNAVASARRAQLFARFGF
jgi:hypothetical protein